MPGETPPLVSEEKWYKPNLAANAPPLRARCRVVWGGRYLIAMRDTHPKTRAKCWAVELGDGIVEYWPPKAWPRSMRNMTDEPELFQPRNADDWPYPLPAPERTISADGRMFSTKGSGRYNAMSAQAAQSDATMREIESALGFTLDDLARERAEDAHKPEGVPSRWWRDASLITYSPPGSVSREEAEARVLRAILTDGLRPHKMHGALNRGWPQEFVDWIEAQKRMSEDPRSDVRERFAPSPDDVSDSLVAMKWFAALDPPQLRHDPILFDFTRDQVLLILRAIEPPYTWRQIARHELVGRVSHSVAQKYYRQAVDRIWRAANGLQVFDHVSVRDELGALRERNRAYKRSIAGV